MLNSQNSFGIFLCLVGSSVWANQVAIESRSKFCLEHAASTAAILECSNKTYEEWDDELNSIYKTLLLKLTPVQAIALRESQRKWLIFRDKEFRLIDAIFNSLDGSLMLPIRLSRRISIVSDRVSQLSDFIVILKKHENAFDSKIFEIGGGHVLIAVPDGFLNGELELSVIWENIRKIQVGNTTLAAFFVHKQVVADFLSGASRGIAPYFTVRYPNENRNGVVSQQEFDRFRMGMLAFVKNGSTFFQEKQLQEHIDKFISNFGESGVQRFEINFERPVLVSIDVNQSDRVAYTQLMSAVNSIGDGSATRNQMVQTVVVALIRGKIVSLNMIDEVSSRATVDLNRSRALSWMDKTIGLN